MHLSDWHKESSWLGKAAFVGRLALLAALIALPIHGPLVPLPLVLGIVLLLPQVLAFGRLRDKGLLLLPVLFYLLHVVGMAYSIDIDFGLFDLEVKLSLLLVPLIAAGIGDRDGRGYLRPAMLAFSLGLLVAMLLSVHSAYTCYMEHGWMECFTQRYLSAYLHPSYMAWFACWALFYWGRSLVDTAAGGRIRKIAGAFFLLLLLVYIVMLASKSGLIGLLIVILALAVHALRRLPRRTLIVLGIGSAVVLGFPAFLLAPVLSNRITEAVNAVEALIWQEESSVPLESSTDERLIAWDCSLKCLSAAPWGAGTGDIKHALMACYEEKGAAAAIDLKLNSHSQILQSAVALGWPGLLLVCALMLVPLVIALRRKDHFLSIFAMLFIVNAAVESVLEVQAGVVFFILFYAILVRRSSNVPQEKPSLP